MMRSNQLEPAVQLAAKYLSNINNDARVSFAELCQKAGRIDVWQQVTRDQNDLLGFTAALLAKGNTP